MTIWHLASLGRQFLTYCFPMQKEIQTGLSLMCLSCHLYLTPGKCTCKWGSEKLHSDDSTVKRHCIAVASQCSPKQGKAPNINRHFMDGFQFGQIKTTHEHIQSDLERYTSGIRNELAVQGFLRKEVKYRRPVFCHQLGLVHKNWLSYEMEVNE